MVLLTGLHPYNVEPPLSTLHSLGPITPPALHYVRNHGSPPSLSWSSHTLTIKFGHTERAFSMDNILGMEAFTQPVTLVCAGNRRKEQVRVRAYNIDQGMIPGQGLGGAGGASARNNLPPPHCF